MARKEPVIKINRKACLSCGTCAVLAPKTFELDKKMICKTKDGPLDDLKIIKNTADNCPVGAITIEPSKE